METTTEPDRALKCLLAGTVQRQGPTRYAEAEQYRQEVLDGRRRLLGDYHVETLDAMFRLGVLLLWQKRMRRLFRGETRESGTR